MSRTVLIGGRAPQRRDVTTRLERRKGISKNRADYDRRRRLSKHTPTTETYMGLIRQDPCIVCGERPEPGQVQDVDHIVPLNAKGIDQWENMAAACRRCNRGRKDTPLLLYLLRRNA